MTSLLNGKFFLSLCALCLMVLFSIYVHADSQRNIEYGYDGAGNIISINSTQNLNPPVVSNLSPTSIRINLTTTFTVTGSDLHNVNVTADHPGLTISDVTSDGSMLTFELLASEDVPLGNHTLTFTTRLGSVTEQLEVLPELPLIIVLPAPLTLEPGGAVVTLDIFLTSPDIFDHTLNISVADPNIASVNVSSVTIQTGQTRPTETIQVTSNNLGFTSLDITTANLKDELVNLFVTDHFVPGIGTHTAYAKRLSLFKPSPSTDPNTVQLSPLVSPVLSVNVEETISGTTPVAPLVSPVMSVVKGLNPSTEATVSPVVSPILSLLKDSDTTTQNVVEPVASPVLSLLKESNTSTGSLVSPLVSPVMSINKETTP